MKVIKRKLKTVQLHLASDGGRVLQIMGTETRRIFGIFTRQYQSVAFVPKQADGMKVTRSYMDDGVFNAPQNDEGKHRCVVVERRYGLRVLCNCGWQHFENFNAHADGQDRSFALRRALNKHLAHADEIAEARKIALKVVQ